MARAKTNIKETTVVVKNYKDVILEALTGKESATTEELTRVIQQEIPFLRYESPFKVKAEYVLPTLEKSQCFVCRGENRWALSRVFLNLENEAEKVLKSEGMPMSFDALSHEVAARNSLHALDIPLNLDEDDRFQKISVGKDEYWFLKDWELCNDYVFGLLVENDNHPLSEEEILDILVKRFKKSKKNAILLLGEDSRFRRGTDGKISVFPRVMKKFRKSEVPKSILNETFKKLESGEKTVSLVKIAEEYLSEPFLLTLLKERFEEDLRFSVSGDKVKRSKLTVEQIREIKRKERQQKKLERELLEPKSSHEDDSEEVDETDVLPDVEVEIVEPATSDVVLKELPVQTKQAEAEKSDVRKEEVPAPLKTHADEVFNRRRSTVIKKIEQIPVEEFDLDSVGVNKEDVASYLKRLTDHDGYLNGLGPARFDDLLCRYLPMKVADYRYTHPVVRDFIVDLARPRLDQIVLDPVCGRGDVIRGALSYLKGTLRKDNELDLETFSTFCDEQMVGLEQSSFIVEGARLNLRLNGFSISLLEECNSLEDTDMLIEEMYSLVIGDFFGFNPREMLGFTNRVYGVLCEDGVWVCVVDGHHLEDVNEFNQRLQELFQIRYQIVFHDYDGQLKNVLYLVKSQERSQKTKVFRLESHEQFARVLDLIY